MTSASPETPQTSPHTPHVPQTPLPTTHTPYTPDYITPRSCRNSAIEEGNPDNSQHNIAEISDSGKSSCSPVHLLDCSVDSGIGETSEETNRRMKLQKRIQQYKRILIALERDKAEFRTLRERLSKIVKKKGDVCDEDQTCNVCNTELKLDDKKSYATCVSCKKRICLSAKCADWLAKNSDWECQMCHTSKESLAQTSSWVAEQMSFNQQKYVHPMRARSEIFIPIGDTNDSIMQFESVSQIGINSTDITAEQKLKIREYVEELIADMLGGSLDKIKVEQLSKSENYIKIFHKYHSKLSNIFMNLENTLCLKVLREDLPAIVNGHSATAQNGSTNNNSNRDNDFADVSQTRLRHLIETIISETLRLPQLSTSRIGAVSEISLDTRSSAVTSPLTNGLERRHRTEHYFQPKNYQDLLATAVLNKIVDAQGNVKHLSESTPHLSGCVIDSNCNIENESTTSGSSVEPRSDYSFAEADRLLNLNEATGISLSGSETNLNANENCILPTGRESALSDYIASHLVPLPDLSAPVTESEEDDYISVTSTDIGDGTWENNWLFKKKHTSMKNSSGAGTVGMLVPAPKDDIRAQIGDKTADEISDLSEMGSDTDDSSLGLLRSDSEPLNDRLLNKQLIGGQNNKIVLDELIERSSMISSTSPAAGEPVFTETKNEHVVDSTKKIEAVNTNINQTPTTEKESGLISPPKTFKDEYENMITTPIAGSIAEREYKKWYNAVDMPNNPYAPEALQRRISGSQERFIDLPNISPSTEQNPIDLLKSSNENIDEDERSRECDYKRYSRDYYINDTKHNTVNSKLNTPLGTPLHNITDEPSTDHITINEANKPNKTSDVYQALPAQVVEENVSSIETISNQSATTTTSDDSDTVRIYNFQKQETTILRESKTPQPISASMEVLPTEKVLQKRPYSLQLGNSQPSIIGIGATPPRGSTPIAFKFLQPKRKIIDPSQVLSFDEDDAPPPTPSEEKLVIEEEVAQVLPSVKALAQAFLLSSTKCTPVERRWKSAKLKSASFEPRAKSVSPTLKIRSNASMADIADDVTIASDLSSLETDPSTNKEIYAKDSTPNPTTDTSTTPMSPSSSEPARGGILKNNIAFFENLKFK